MNSPEWRPRNYVLQITEHNCVTCQQSETSSQLWLVSEHVLRKDVTRRTEAHWIDHRLPRGTSKRSSSVCTCANCFEEYSPVRPPSHQDMTMLHPGDPNKRLIRSLEDIL